MRPWAIAAAITGLWWLAAILLALALAAQLLHHNRQTLVAHPWFERPVQSVLRLVRRDRGAPLGPQAYDLRQLGGDVLVGQR